MKNSNFRFGFFFVPTITVHLHYSTANANHKKDREKKIGRRIIRSIIRFYVRSEIHELESHVVGLAYPIVVYRYMQTCMYLYT